MVLKSSVSASDADRTAKIASVVAQHFTQADSAAFFSTYKRQNHMERQIAQTHSTLQRLEPLLPNCFTTADTVDKARTAETTLRAQREGAVATINLEELHLSYCKVFAPFSGRVINLNISAGAHVTAGVPVFSLLDTSKWYVIANFR